MAASFVQRKNLYTVCIVDGSVSVSKQNVLLSGFHPNAVRISSKRTFELVQVYIDYRYVIQTQFEKKM